MWAIPTGTRSVLKKNQVKGSSIWSRVPETDSGLPIGSDRNRGVTVNTTTVVVLFWTFVYDVDIL